MKTIKIKIDKELFYKSKKYAEAAGYSSAEEFINHTIESAISQLEESPSSDELREKLKGLGYIT